MGKSKKPCQLSLPYKSWGGVRRRAGRKRLSERPQVSHRTRAPLASRFPVLVTVRVRKGLASLRRGDLFKVVRRALVAGCDRFGFRVVHFSVQSNHLHLMVEAAHRVSLSRGMQGLLIRIAKRLNRFLGRAGSVFADRYHDRILRTPREVRNALAYVLNNGLRHGMRFLRRPKGGSPGTERPVFDPCASGAYFDGWRERFRIVGLDAVDPPVAPAHTWLLNLGWRRHRLISVTEVPGM